MKMTEMTEYTGDFGPHACQEIMDLVSRFDEEGKEFLSNYRSGLYGYTYLE